MALLVNRARMEGMVVFDYAPRYQEGVTQLAAWLKDGSIQSRTDVVDGLEHFPSALLMLFEGKNFGKLVLKVAEA
jgi:NADPH-dependent curcumin reductase CurA